MYKFILLFLLSVLLNLCVAAQTIPPLQSKTDEKGNRQGQWIIWYNEAWKETQNLNEVEFYRSINYKDDLPDKIVQDYYANGVVQMKGVFLKDRPKPVYDGWISFYYETSQERLRMKYNQGEFTKEFLAFLKDGSPVSLPWDEPAGQAENEKDPRKRIPLLLKASANAEALFTTNSLEYTQQLESLGYEYYLTDDYQSAATAFEKTAMLYKKHLPQDDIRTADALYFLSLCQFHLGKSEDEKRTLLQLVELIDTHHHGSYPDLVSVLSSLGTAYENEPEKAFPYLSRGFDLVLKTTNTVEDYQAAIPLIYNIHSYCMDVNDWEKALEINNQSMALVKKWEGKKSENYIKMVSLYGIIERGLGKGKGFKESIDQQVDLAASTFSANDPKYASVLVSKGAFEENQGNFAEAERVLLQARKIFIDSNHTSDPVYGTLLHTLMSIYHELGNEEKETEEELNYQEFIMKENGHVSIEFVSYVQMRSMHLVEQKDYVNAEKALIEAQRIIKKIDSLKTSAPASLIDLEANGYFSLAMVYIYMYQDLNNQITKTGTPDQKSKWVMTKEEVLDRAEEYLEKSITLRQGSSQRMDMEMQMIFLKILQSDFEGAQTVAIEAQKDIKNLWGEDYPLYADVLITRASLSVQTKDYQEAFSFYQQAFLHYKNYSNAVVPYLSESERQMFFAGINNKLQQFTSFMIQHHTQLSPESKGSVLEAVMLNKSLGLNQLKDILQQLTVNNDAVGLKLIEEWKNKKERLIKVYQSEKIENTIAQQKKLEEEVNQLERNISTRSNDFAAMNSLARATWKDLSKTLKPGEALVEILRTQIQRTLMDTSYVAIVLRYGDMSPELIEIQHAVRLETKPLKFYNNSIHAQLPDTRSYKEFWLPIKASLKGTKKVYFSPDGLYNQINLETLFNVEAGNYLADEVELEMITSSRQLLKSKQQQRVREVVMIGNPDFGGTAVQAMINPKDTDQLNRAFDPENVTDLPGTKEEINGLAEMLTLAKIKNHPFSQAEASEATIRMLQSPQVLHLATHGFFLKDITNEDEDFSIMGFDKKKLLANPMLRSGLLLAGCRNSMKNRTEDSDALTDGILTAYEVTNLNLSNTQLVVMSACETGLGKIMNGEGVIGLPRAFLSAGAEGVLMSLWKVDDEATQIIMREFYKKWIELGNQEMAWRSAQKSLRSKYPEPYYWGAFIMLR